MSTGKQEFLETYDEEHARTMRVLKAYPKDKLDLRPHPKSKTARELAFVFILERYLGTKVWNDEFAKGAPQSAARLPKPPEDWDELLATLEKANKDFRDLVERGLGRRRSHENVHFFSGPKTMGEISRKDWIWFLAPRPDPSPRPVLDLPANGGREGAVDLRTERRRAVDLRPQRHKVTQRNTSVIICVSVVRTVSTEPKRRRFRQPRFAFAVGAEERGGIAEDVAHAHPFADGGERHFARGECGEQAEVGFQSCRSIW